MECPACHTPNADSARFCAKCGALLPAASTDEADPLLGSVVGGRFRIIGVLGEGGMGRVYTAEQQMGTTVRKVAVKTLLAQYTKDQQVVQRFNRECATVAELEHPNTINVYDFGQTASGELYIAMELLSGKALETELEAGAMAPERVDHILLQICGSLREAHDKGIVHRDLKPANVYLTDRAGEGDFVKVLDFGIAKRDEKHSKHEAKLTQQGTVLGTPPYMSPEQFRGQELDARSDIYSLGVMAYEMLTGRLPFDADTPWAWATQHMTAQPFPFETVPMGSQVPAKMKAAVMRALSKDKTLRQQSVKEFFEEFTMGGGRTTGLGMGRPSGADLAAASAAAVSAGSLTGAMTSARTQSGDMALTPAITGPQAVASYASSPGMPLVPGGVPTGSGQAVQAPPAKKGGAGLILGVAGGVAAIALVGFLALRGGSGGKTGGPSHPQSASASATASAPGGATGPATSSSAPEPTASATPTVEPTSVPSATPSAVVTAGPTAVVAIGPGAKADAACREAATHAARDELGAARSAFMRCEGPGKVLARAAIDQAEIRHKGGGGKHRCPPGKHCPRGK